MLMKKNIAIFFIICQFIFANERKEKFKKARNEKNKYTIEQASSYKAQLNTIAFSALAFLTGTFESDTFLPPGKVADFFGFQYMRDIDKNEMGHNTNFLTRAANNVLYILTDEQKEILSSLAKEQVELYEDYALARLTLIKAFRVAMESDESLDQNKVIEHSKLLYKIDANLSYARAEAYGKIISTFTDEQKAYLDQMSFEDSNTWNKLEGQDILNRRKYTHEEDVAMMTYASELFSWYKGSVYADTYFCPERHGTYFGGFYMKDFPAMGNPDYFISTSVTGDKGEEFLNTISANQKRKLEALTKKQQSSLKEIIELRGEISQLLRKFMTGNSVNKSSILDKMKKYGAIEGLMSYNYAVAFANIYKNLSEAEKNALYELRDLDIYPDTPYKYSDPLRKNGDFEYQTLLK